MMGAGNSTHIYASYVTCRQIRSTDVHVSSTHAIINMINMLRFTAGLSKCYHAQIIIPAGLRASYSTVTETQSSLLNSLILTIVDFAADMARPLPLQLLR